MSEVKSKFEISYRNEGISIAEKGWRTSIPGILRLEASNGDKKIIYDQRTELWDTAYQLIDHSIKLDEEGQSSGYFTCCTCGDRSCDGSYIEFKQEEDQIAFKVKSWEGDGSKIKSISGLKQQEIFKQIHEFTKSLLKVLEGEEIVTADSPVPEQHTREEMEDKLEELNKLIE